MISVIINCYNGAEYLREAIDSVLQQTYEDWEIIFWDNQSTDESAKILKSYKDPRLKYFYAPTHTFLYEARNYAIEKASGEFLAFLDVDDWWLPEKLALQLPLFSDPEVGMACGNYIVVSERANARWIFRPRLPSGWVLSELLDAYFVGMLTLIIRRSAFESLAYPCDPRFHISGDFDLVIRLSLKWKLGAVQAPVACYRLHDANETDKHRARAVAEQKLWCAEASKNPQIARAPGFRRFIADVRYREAMNELMRLKRRSAFSVMCQIPWGMKKIKVAIALLLPRGLWTLRHMKPVGSAISDLGQANDLTKRNNGNLTGQ